jgi:hypothetical protein
MSGFVVNVIATVTIAEPSVTGSRYAKSQLVSAAA